MHALRHAQRRYIIASLDNLLYQLHTISFFLSPTLLPYLSRCIGQFQLSRPTEYHTKNTLLYWYLMVLVFNFPSVWGHAMFGAAKGPSLILDFVGHPYRSSRLHMLLFDLVIIASSFVLVTIAHEHSFSTTNASRAPTNILGPPESEENGDPFKTERSPYVVDIRLGSIIDEIRNPTPPQAAGREELLPIPNTMPMELRNSLRMLMRTRADITAARGDNNGEQGRTDPPGPRNRAVPGSMEPDDED